jgi:F420H(2)-dependent quinone reductase
LPLTDTISTGSKARCGWSELDTVEAAMNQTLEDLHETPRVARVFARWTAPRSAPRWVVRLHRWEYLHSRGRFGYGVFGAPILLLHTSGRFSGKPRSTPVVFALDEGRVVVVASNDGKDASPNWLLNLHASQEAELWLGRRKMRATPHILHSDAPDYQRLWNLMNEVNYGRYEYMQAKATRPFPIVVFTLSA